ncbi:hypothetical protein [Paramicrobacterium fandaimingii]|uniref:hypothetical protein n=1 Tax=Paramicrobacterium fandaimingii TaxID=2708079 RepID=UPI00142384CD|nr:hypothetical protein [Microbacterium fandaimingii]
MSLRRRACVALIAVGVLFTPVLSGCSFVEQTVNQTVQDAVREATGGDVELTEGVPDGFPTDGVPLIDGSIRGATQTDGSDTHWVVLVSGDVSADEAKKKLTDAGFSVDGEASTAKLGSVMTMSNDDYDVTVVSASESVLYTVTSRG